VLKCKLDQRDIKMSKPVESILLIGDLHIPQRCTDIPKQFKEIIAPGRVQHIICVGNFGDRVDWLKSLCSNVHLIQGDYDEGNYPENKLISVGEWKIGAVHGHQLIPWGDKEALSSYQRLLDCDVLVYGHTHIPSVESMENKYFINPGSVTGAYSSVTSEINPCFKVLSTQGKELTVFSYELEEDELRISQTQLYKN